MAKRGKILETTEDPIKEFHLATMSITKNKNGPGTYGTCVSFDCLEHLQYDVGYEQMEKVLCTLKQTQTTKQAMTKI